MGHDTGPVLGYLLKGYPRLSETFITNEILLLEQLGFSIKIYALRNPAESKVHSNVRRVAANVSYIPDYFWRSFRALVMANLLLFFDRPATYWKAFRYAAVRSIVRRSSSTIKRFVQAGYLVQRHLRERPVSHLHAHFAHGPTTTAHFASLLTGIPYSFTAHAKDLYIQERGFLERKISYADFVISCTEYNRRILEECSAGVTPIFRIYHGVDLDFFRIRSAAKAEGGHLILSVGRFVPKKGFPTLVDALHRLSLRGLDFRAMIVGWGPQERQLREMVAGYSLQDRVTLVGKLSQEELLETYEEAAVVALACEIQDDGDRDGIPNVLVEAMAMGIPVVSTNIASMPELVEDGVTGLLVPPRDPERLAEALERLIRDPESAKRMSRNARDFVEESFDARRNSEDLRRIFSKALNVDHEKLSDTKTMNPEPIVKDKLHTLAITLDVHKMRQVLQPIIQTTHRGAVIRDLNVDILRRRSKRCVLRYRMEIEGSSNGKAMPTTLIGKVFKANRGEQVFSDMRELWGRGFDRSAPDLISMPEPLAFDSGLCLLIQEEVPGEPLNELLRSDPSPDHMRQLAQVLVKLHSCGMKPGDPFRIHDHLSRCHPKHHFLCLACPDIAEEVEYIVQSAIEIEKGYDVATYTPMHGDFHMGQVHIEGGRSWLIDFDALSYGDPAADLGNVLVFLKGKARKSASFGPLSNILLEEYFRVMDPAIAERIPLYEAITHLRRACKRLRFQPPKWERKVRRMIAEGVACIDRMKCVT